jgi:hypothetical protein
VDPFYVNDLGGIFFEEYPPAGYSVGGQTKTVSCEIFMVGVDIYPLSPQEQSVELL